MHLLCCGRRTNHKKTKKSTETTKTFTRDDDVSSSAIYVRNHSSSGNSPMCGEVKRSSLKKEDENGEENGEEDGEERNLTTLLHSKRLSCDEEQGSSASASQRDQDDDGRTLLLLSTFGKVVSPEVPTKKLEPDYDNYATTFNYNNDNDPDAIASLPRTDMIVTLSDVDSGGCEGEWNLIGSIASSSVSSFPNESNRHSPAAAPPAAASSSAAAMQTSKVLDDVNVDLDAALALMKSLVSSHHDDVIPDPVQRSDLSEHRTDEHDALKQPGSNNKDNNNNNNSCLLATIRQQTNASSSDPQNLISTEKTSIDSSKDLSLLIFSRSNHSQPTDSASVDDEKMSCSSATPFRLHSSSELRPQDAAAAAAEDGDADDGTRGCLSRESDASLTPASISTMEAAATKAKGDNSSSSSSSSKGTTTIDLDYYCIYDNMRYSDPNNVDKSPPSETITTDISASSLLSGRISMETETGASSTTVRTSENDVDYENGAQESISTSCQRRSPQPICLSPQMEECSMLTSSGGDIVSDSSNVVNLVFDGGEGVGGGEGGGAGRRRGFGPPSPVDQFKALRLDVLKATSKLLDFVGEIWRKQENLHGRLSTINLLCLHLKTALQELENFGFGLVSHWSAEEERQAMEKKLFSQMNLLQNIRDGINRYLESLERENALNDEERIESSERGSDESLRVKVGNIILLTKVIPGLVKTFGSFFDDIVKGNFSNKPVAIISVTDDRTPLSSNEHSTEDSRAISNNHSSSSSSSKQDPHLTRRVKSDFPNDRQEEIPPVIPPKSSKVIMSDSKVLYENIMHGSGEDHVRTAACYGNLSYSSPTVSLSGSDCSCTTTEVSDELGRPSVDGDPTVPRSKGGCHDRCHVATDSLEGKDNSNCLQTSVVLRQKQRQVSPSSASLHSCTATDPSDGLLVDNRFSTSELVTPDIRSSGISQTVQTRLEELQRQATSRNVLLHTDADCSFMDYDLPAGIMEENLPNLCESDCKLLLYYSDEMFGHWKVLDSAASAFFQCMEMTLRQLPKVFIMHSRFVIVAGHKMTYIGDVLARNVTDNDARDWLLTFSNDLCDRLKQAVRKTKGAALSFPAVKPLQLMVDAIKDVTDSAYELREVLFRLAYIGRADQHAAFN